jgi:hypothetical protein
MAENDGIGGAIAPLIGEAPAETAEQLDLLAQEPFLGEIRREGRSIGRVGRPPGARNKRTQEWADYILSRGRSPLEALAEVVNTPLEDLRAKLKCDLLEAAEFWRKCVEALAPYVHQRMPQAVQVDGANAGLITIINMSAPRVDEPEQLSPYGLDMQLEQNQGLSEADRTAPHDEPPFREGNQ